MKLPSRAPGGVALALTAVVLVASFAAQTRAASLDIGEWLRRPGVRLVVVEFYATWCKPCMDAVPRWKALHARHRNDGLRLIVVNTRDPQGRCVSPGWNPNDLVCDEAGVLSKQWGGGKDLELPSAFLWSWQGNLLVERGHVQDVERAVAEYLRTMPRAVVQVASGSLGDAPLLANLVRSRVDETGKIEVVAGDDERALLDELRRRSNDPRYRDDAACKPGQELPANSLLRAAVSGEATPTLFLELHNIETGCVTAAGSAPWNPARPGTSVAGALDRLLGRLRRSAIQLPGASTARTEVQRPSRPGLLRLGADQEGTRYRVVDIDVKGVLSGAKPETIELPLREAPYRVVFTKDGFVPYGADVRLDTRTPVQRLQARMVREATEPRGTKRGFLIVKSDPENAEVFVDGQRKEARTPTSIDLAAGTHTVRVRRDSYVDWTREVTVPPDGDASISARLVPDSARLVIHAAPPDAQILLNGQRVGVGRYDEPRQASGGYALRVTAPLYEPLERDLFIEPGVDVELDADLEPRFGSIELCVTTEVEDRAAGEPRIYVDGKPTDAQLTDSSACSGSTARIERVASGTHAIEVQLPRFNPHEARVTVTDGGVARVAVDLSARFGTLVVTSEPPGLSVRIDGDVVGQTPLEHDEDVGAHSVEVVGEVYHRPFERSVLLDERQTQRIHAVLDERHGALAVASSPPDAEIRLDGELAGTAPVTLRDVRVGIRRVEARLDGYTPTVMEIQVREAETRRTVIELDQLGALEVHCLAPEADRDAVELHFDGRALSTASHRFEGVATGPHEVACISPRGHEVRRTVQAAPGHEVRHELDLTDPQVLLEGYESRAHTHTVASWVLLGVASAAAVAGGVTLGFAFSEDDRMRGAHGDFVAAATVADKSQAQAAFLDAETSRDRLEAASIGSFVVAGATLAAGLTTLLLAPAPPDEIGHLVSGGSAPGVGLSVDPARGDLLVTVTLDGRF